MRLQLEVGMAAGETPPPNTDFCLTLELTLPIPLPPAEGDAKLSLRLSRPKEAICTSMVFTSLHL